MDCIGEKKGDFLVIKVDGRMDANTAPKFEEEFNSWFEKGELKFIFDFQGLEYMSSAGLRSIIAIGKKITGSSGEIRFCGMKGMVKEVFSLAGYDTIFEVYGTIDEALK